MERGRRAGSEPFRPPISPAVYGEDEPARWHGLPTARMRWCDVSDQLVADLGHIREGSGVSAVMEVTAPPLSPPVRCIVAQGSNLVPRLASAADEYELAFASPPDATPAFECRSPELLLPIIATGEIERKAGVRLVDAARKPLPTTAFGWQRF